MAMMPITDSMFLLGESREHPVHVAALKVFEIPPGAGPEFVAETHRRMLECVDVAPIFRRRPRRPFSRLGQWAWTDDEQLDLEYHVRLSALPRPGRVRELLELISRLHGSLLDRHRPLWEFHLIEGLEGNRFAMYTKVHHALLDGVAALRLMRRVLSEDPDERDMAPPWVFRNDGRTSVVEATDADSERYGTPWRGLWAAAQAIGDVAGMTPALVRSISGMLTDQAAMLPFQAPKSMLNVPITGARRFAAQSWSLERVRGVARKTDATVNDVVLAMCAGALRRYLIEQDALPERPLVAATPVSVRTDGRSVAAGAGVPTPPPDRTGGKRDLAEPGSSTDRDGDTAVGLILCSLATHLADDAARLIEISNAMRRGKEFYKGRSPLQITALSALPIMPLALYLLPAALRVSTPPFNLVISNVPGPSAPLYFNGARMQGLYPLSLPYDGQALNIAVTRYAGNLEFGLIGCRRSVPHLQRMLGHLEDSLAALESSTS